MTQTVEIFYSFQCPYSYLAIDRLSEIENKFDVSVLWQPFSAKASGNNAPIIQPDKASYIKEDIHFAYRLAESTQGRVFFTAGKDLDRYVVWDYVQRKREIIS